MRSRTRTAGLALLLSALAWAAQAPSALRGLVRGGGVALPGAQVDVVRGREVHTTLTDDNGAFAFADLAPGDWTLRVAITGFAPSERQVTVPADGIVVELTVAPLPAAVPPPVIAAPPAASASAPSAAAAALAVNGSVDNGATSSYGLSPAFGNNRPPGRALFNGAFGFILDNSALDARSFSFAGNTAPKPAYGNLTGLLQLGGPLLIPGLTHASTAPFFFLAYQKSSSLTATSTPALVPTLAQRAQPAAPQAAALLALYPLPNLAGPGFYNYQATLDARQHQDKLQIRLSSVLSATDQLSGSLALDSTRGDATNLFGFLDGTSTLGLNSSLHWRHAFAHTLFATFGLEYSRLADRATPFFAGRENVAAAAGIAGGDASPLDWGPPALQFSDGIAGLSDQLPAHNRNQTAAVTAAATWNRTDHNWTFGGYLRRLEFNLFQQRNPRGGFAFNGAATGDPFGDFLAGEPDAVTLGFGNADKYFRQNDDDLYVNDDWRVGDSLSLNLGARWEYASPAVERYGRLANLAVGADFASAAPVLANPGDPLLRPDRSGLEPRLGLAWRPLPASSLLLRAGYGIYRDTGEYETIALQLAQQAPFATSLSLERSAAVPLTLATGLQSAPASAASTADVFAIDPHFRIGYAQTWNASLQRDLPDGMVMTASYLGTKGTRGVQHFYPNTTPPGAPSPCPACPLGFLYEASNGNSTFEAGKALLQRRFHNGLAATVSYTYAHAINDQDASAQDWRNLDAERARSDDDQRHVLTLNTQYSTGGRWRGRAAHVLLAGWTVLTDLKAASGQPLTPTTLIPVPGTGFFGVRPDAMPGGAFSLPQPGHWGTAGRNSINGPSQFTLNASLQRQFALPRNLSAAFRLDAVNALNHTAFSGLNPLFGSPQFLLPSAALPMRSVQTSLRVTF